ncbi:MAG: glutamate mutase L [Actinobacteria bacterium]|nr:glutamate mutase L [Actinomycetota bacterium]
MGLVALADFGSTYTKVALVDRGARRLVARAEAPTSIATDVIEGYEAALAAALARAGAAGAPQAELAVSSAGGGLRVAAVGLVADLTAAAARQAALNAGARVGAVLSGRLGAAAVAELRAAAPEIVLFAGGTDGGQGELVLANARTLAAAGLEARFVVACNREVAEGAGAILAGAGGGVEIADNVMPQLGRLEIEGARAAISRAFLEHVIGGKRMSADRRFAAMVRMPTPEAVLAATRLLALGTGRRAGAGGIAVVDVGGATTDVHSSRAAQAATPGIEEPLLPTPLTLRTVEGDLGMRAGAAGALDADRRWIAARLGEDGAVADLDAEVGDRGRHPAWIPATAAEARLDRLLAVGCVAHALERHCGTMVLTVSPKGPPTLAVDGPDLREIRHVIGTGGVFAHRSDGREILLEALARREPRSLTPVDPTVSVDGDYVIAAAGLLAELDSDLALEVLERELDKN